MALGSNPARPVPCYMQELESLKAVLSSPKKIAITTHFKPDADALGSSLGMANYLIKKGHTVQVITPSDYPEFLFWMKGHPDVMVYQSAKDAEINQIYQDSDVIITLDFSVLSRINGMGEMVRASGAVYCARLSRPSRWSIGFIGWLRS